MKRAAETDEVKMKITDGQKENKILIRLMTVKLGSDVQMGETSNELFDD